jgi:hypothetical protein
MVKSRLTARVIIAARAHRMWGCRGALRLASTVRDAGGATARKASIGCGAILVGAGEDIDLSLVNSGGHVRFARTQWTLDLVQKLA